MSIERAHFSTSGSLKAGHGSMGYLSSSGSTSLNHYDLDELSTSGSTTLADSTIRVIQASGLLCASNCKLGDVRSSGSSDFIKCQFSKNLTASGSLKLESSRIEGNLVCSGVANISQSTIQNSVEFSGNRLEISNSSMEEIIVKPTSGSYLQRFEFFGFKYSSSQEAKPPEVILNGHDCHIKTIRFESEKPGIVFLQSGIHEPEVINGRIEKTGRFFS